MRRRNLAALTGFVFLACLLMLFLPAGCQQQGGPDQAPEGIVSSPAGRSFIHIQLELAEAREKLMSLMTQAAAAPPPPAPPLPEAPFNPHRGSSSGQETGGVAIPSVSGMSYEAATATLNGLGLNVSANEGYSESVAAGLICSQSPTAGTSAVRGSAVSVTVSLGSAWITCPSCGGAGSAVEKHNCPECGGSGFCDT